MAYDATQRKNLGERIRRRREQLELSLREVTEPTGMSTTTWIKAEHGETSPLGTTLVKFDRALGWPRGTCEAILAGEPVTSDDPEKPEPDDTVGSAVRWVQTDPDFEPYVREFILAAFAKTRRGRVFFEDAHRGPGRRNPH